ncbi:MAG: tetratricopeptide repeat protein, partial [bacterium]|nr:tetratricopeptide repeat protein [bacterium]
QLVLGSLAGIAVEPLDNALIELHGSERVLAALAVATRYAGLLVAPMHLSADYSHAAIDVQHISSLEIFAGLLLAACSLGAAWRYLRRPDVPGLGMVWLVVCFSPLVNVLFPIGTILAERLTYAPSLGFCLFLGWALVRSRRHLGPRLMPTLGLALLLVLGLRTTARCADWRSERSLFQAVVAHYPESARGHKGLAKALSDAGQLAAAEGHYRRAIEIYPRFDTAHYNLGILLHGTARFEEALVHFERACSLRPTFADAHLNRGAALFQLGRVSQALAATQRALALRPDWDLALQNLSDIQATINRQGNGP